MTSANLYKEMVEKFAGKSISFESAQGMYRAGTVLEVYEEDPNILMIMDEDGAEVEVDYKNRDVVVL